MIREIQERSFLVTIYKIEELLEYKRILKLITDIQSSFSIHESEGTLIVVAVEPIMTELIDVSKKSKQKNKVLIWIGEEKGLPVPKCIKDSYNIIFKNHIRKEDITNQIFGFPLLLPDDSIEIPVVDWMNRSINIFFSGCLNMNRVPFYGCLKPKTNFLESLFLKLLSLKFRGRKRLFEFFYRKKEYDLTQYYPNSLILFTRAFNTGLSKLDYINKTAVSKIILSPHGFASSECFRLYEAMRQGVVVITEILPDVPYYKNIPAIQVKDWENFSVLIHELLSNDKYLEELSLKSKMFYDQKLSDNAIAKYMIDRIHSII